MQPAEDVLGRAGEVVLDKFGRQPELLEMIGSESFHEETALVVETFLRQHDHCTQSERIRLSTPFRRHLADGQWSDKNVTPALAVVANLRVEKKALNRR